MIRENGWKSWISLKKQEKPGFLLKRQDFRKKHREFLLWKKTNGKSIFKDFEVHFWVCYHGFSIYGKRSFIKYGCREKDRGELWEQDQGSPSWPNNSFPEAGLPQLHESSSGHGQHLSDDGRQYWGRDGKQLWVRYKDTGDLLCIFIYLFVINLFTFICYFHNYFIFI